MPDYDKIIEHLWEAVCVPHYDNAGNAWEYPKEVQDAAYAAIEAIDSLTTPRVMTFEEIKLLPDESDVFLEEVDCIVVAATISRQGEKWGARTDSTFFYGIESTSYGSDEYYNDDYGRWWRCWTSRPTEEQRKAVKWDV